MSGLGGRSILVALLALSLASPLPLLAGTTTDRRKAKEAELAHLRERIEALRARRDRNRDQYDTLAKQLKAVEERIGGLDRSLRRIEADLEDRTHKLAALKERASGLQESVAVQRDHLARQIRASYAAGRQEFVKILLNQEDPASVGRVMAYYDYLNRARSERIRGLTRTLAELKQVRERISAEAEQLEALREKQLAEQGDLKRTKASRDKVLARVKGELTDNEHRLAKMLADKKELEALIQVLSEALDDIPAEPGNRKPFPSLKGRLHWPIKGRLALRYGARRRPGDLPSQGVTIAATEGAPVRAVSYGRVAFADWLRGYGMLIIVDHGDGYMSLYGHNQSLYKETGDWIEPGEVIASVGSSGGYDRNGLYFEIRKNGHPVNPIRWCRR